jgi:hypothetical protein
MKKIARLFGKAKLGTTLLLTLLVTIWSVPTLGLIITSGGLPCSTR